MPTPLLIATTNPGKIREIQHELAADPALAHFTLLGLKDLPTPPPECVEDRPTFIGNATKKARHYAHLSGYLTLADDSGLCVDALHGAPGVLSARYANVEGDRHTIDAANNAKLLAALQHTPDDQRTARFTCAMALALPDADLATFTDHVEGTLLRSPRGSHGFGYDPLFFFPQFQKTTAELDTHTKSTISHRGKALRRLLHWLKQNPVPQASRLPRQL